MMKNLYQVCLDSPVLNDKDYNFLHTLWSSTNFRYMTFSACQEGFCVLFVHVVEAVL